GQAPSAMCLRLRRGWPLLAAPSISTSVAEYVGSSSPSRGLVHQPGGNFLNLRRFLGRSGAYIIADQFFTAFQDLIVSRGTVASCDEQFFEPVFAVPRVHGFVGPIEVHVVLAQRVAISVKELRARVCAGYSWSQRSRAFPRDRSDLLRQRSRRCTCPKESPPARGPR